MTDEQYNELIQRLDRIIALLHEQSKPKSEATILDRSGFDYYRIMSHDVPLTEAIGKPIQITSPVEIQWQGTCRACYLGTCDKEYPHT